MEEYVSFKQLSQEFGMDRSNLMKYVRRLGVAPHKRRMGDGRNQLQLAVTVPEAELIRKRRNEDGFLGSSKPMIPQAGVFYVIRLIPELDPNRIKLGFTDDLATRLGQHKTASPTARVIKSWPCKRAWEPTILDCLSACHCNLILNEVFECENVEILLERAEQLFALLPAPDSKPPFSEYSPYLCDDEVCRVQDRN